jgi:BCCT, betaine/carnitine/choline family transporter
VFFTDSFSNALATVVGWITDYLGWLYMLMTSFFLAFAVWLALSRYGKIRLGQPDERPEFSRFAWFAMLFQAGMGIGLVFWAVSEPVTHYTDPPLGQGDGGRRLPGPANRLLPLGAAPVGDLRRGRPCRRVLQLSQGHDESAGQYSLPSFVT